MEDQIKVAIVSLSGHLVWPDVPLRVATARPNLYFELHTLHPQRSILP